MSEKRRLIPAAVSIGGGLFLIWLADRMSHHSSEEQGLPAFLEGYRPDMTLSEFTEIMKKRIDQMSCDELYDALDEARMVRDTVSMFDPLHLVLTGFIHEGSIKLQKTCPERFKKLTDKYKLKELSNPINPQPSVCECISRLRDFKNRALGDFYERIKIPEPGPLGVFAMEIPEEEEILEAVEMLKASLENYTKHCPFKITPEVIDLQEKLDTLTTDTATLQGVMSGEYEWTFGDLIEKSEKFVTAAIEGINESVEGARSLKGPMSPIIRVRHECTSLLNNMEAAKKEITEKAERIEGFMSPPEELIKEIDELNEAQRDMYKEYLLKCKADPLKLRMELEAWALQKDRDKEHLEKYDEWTWEHEEELKQDMEKWLDRISGRDHWLWEIEKDITTHQNAIDVFLESEWSNACGDLRWKT